MIGSIRPWWWLATLMACASPYPPDRIFVSNAGSDTVSVIDGASGAVQARIAVGMLPHLLVASPDHQTIYAVLVGSQAVAEIDARTLRVRRTLLTAPVPSLRADGSVIREHAEQSAASHTTCYDCHRTGGAQPKYAGDRPFGVLLSPDGRRLAVSHLRSSDIAVIELESGRIEKTVHLSPAGVATEAVALARLGDEIWVALRAPQPSSSSGALRRLDASTLEARGDVPTGADPGALLAMPGRGRVLVSNFETDSVTEHDGAGNAVRHAVAPGPLGMAALDRDRVLVLDYYSNAVSLLDLASGTPSLAVPLQQGGVPFANPTHAALASDGLTAWIVASGTDGHLLQFDLASAAVVRAVAIDGLSFGLVVLPGTVR